MIIQVFKTMCENCGDEELEYRVGVMGNENEVIIDFLEDMEFECGPCGKSTFLSIEKSSS